MAEPSPEVENIQAIMDLERETRGKRSVVERLTDRVTNVAGSPVFIVVHLVWFGVWIGVNSHRGRSFDPYPFNLLTLAVSLEAIVLTGFVLMAQNRMAQQADRRAHLDLQINLLAEQELTAILKLQCLQADRAGIDIAACDPQLDKLLAKTDVRRLAVEVGDELTAIRAGTTPTEPNAAG
jgi:uncharacterized membrane protein